MLNIQVKILYLNKKWIHIDYPLSSKQGKIKGLTENKFSKKVWKSPEA